MKTLHTPPLLTALAILMLGAATKSQAAIVLTFPTATVAGSLVITQDINFIITTPDSVRALVFDEWVTSDGSLSSIAGTKFSPGTLTYSVNAGSPTGVAIDYLADNYTSTAGNVTANDGYIFFISPLPSVALNDIFTVKAATYTIAAGSLPSGFNPQAQQTFAGNAFLVNASGALISASIPVGAAVPEPGSLGLLALGGLAAATRRRRSSDG